MKNFTLRWGILSTARIIRRNWQGMRDSGAATLVALASRDLGKATALVDELQEEFPWPVKPEALGSYDSLIANPEVDAIYIPLPTGLRKEWVIRAAKAGKHVLCEKPCAISAADLKEMISCCERHGVLFMDGVMFMHDPRYAAIREILDNGVSVGSVKRISSSFSFLGDKDFVGTNIRGQVDLEPTGCLGDLGWYCLRGILWAMNWEMPYQVSGRVLSEACGKDGLPVIMEFSGELDFADGASGAFHCSFLTPGQMWFNVSGTAGYLRIPDFVVPIEENDVAWEVNYQRLLRDTKPGMSNQARMFARFAEDACGGVSALKWGGISLKTQMLLDACVASARTGKPVTLDNTSSTA